MYLLDFTRLAPFGTFLGSLWPLLFEFNGMAYTVSSLGRRSGLGLVFGFVDDICPFPASWE